jgi:hypothetical protein
MCCDRFRLLSIKIGLTLTRQIGSLDRANETLHVFLVNQEVERHVSQG